MIDTRWDAVHSCQVSGVLLSEADWQFVHLCTSCLTRIKNNWEICSKHFLCL